MGAHLKSVRQMYGLSQRELAKRAGVTNGLISLIEQNRVSPSVSSLKKVLDGIPMALADFFTLDLGGQPQVFFPRQDLSDIGTSSVELRLVVVADRQKEGVDVRAGAELGGRGAGLDQDRQGSDEGEADAGHGACLTLPFGT